MSICLLPSAFCLLPSAFCLLPPALQPPSSAQRSPINPTLSKSSQSHNTRTSRARRPLATPKRLPVFRAIFHNVSRKISDTCRISGVGAHAPTGP